ncbi:MAG: PilZ domain-containing protein [Syntrophaceae bacterium]|nr:PilZ domain-containing protein [Deltaproteobacteria bacterium]
MVSDSTDNERRRENRKKVKITVLLKVGVLLSGRGIAKDISDHGMRLMSPQIFKSMSSVQSKDFAGSPLRIMLPAEALTVNGVIVWADLKKGEGAVTITSTSDDNRWQEICSGK